MSSLYQVFPCTKYQNVSLETNHDKDEFNQIEWFGIVKIPFEKSDPHMKRFIQKILGQSRLNSCLASLRGVK